MTAGSAPPTTRPEEEGAAVQAVPLRHPWRWVAAAVVIVLLALLAWSVATNPRFYWPLVGQYLFSPRVLRGLVNTIWLTVAAMVIGIVGGVVLAVMRLSANPVLSGSSWLYIWFFRGTPVLVQLFFWAFISALYPVIGFPPFGFSANGIITVPIAALLGLALNEAAYMAEIVRAGILSVDEGQTEAAQALGMRGNHVMFRIVLPQAMRVIIPPTGNETINMLKTTSLVSVISMSDLLYSVQLIYAVNFRQIPLLIVACIWYLLLTSLLTVGQYFIERHYGRGISRNQRTTWFGRLFGGLTRTGRAGAAVSPAAPDGPAAPRDGGGV